MMIAWRGRARRAATSDPMSEPIARIDPRSPYSPAPLPNTSVAMSAVVIWKLKPNVPAQKTIARMSMMSGRARTYRTPSRSWPLARPIGFVGRISDWRMTISETTTAA